MLDRKIINIKGNLHEDKDRQNSHTILINDQFAFMSHICQLENIQYPTIQSITSQGTWCAAERVFLPSLERKSNYNTIMIIPYASLKNKWSITICIPSRALSGRNVVNINHHKQIRRAILIRDNSTITIYDKCFTISWIFFFFSKLD